MSWIRIWKNKKRRYGWRHVSKACERLAIEYDHATPTRIIALARGGLIPATIMANKLGVRHVYSLGVSSYELQHDGQEQQGTFNMYQRLPSNASRVDKHDIVLLVDDISDQGETFIYAKQYIEQVVGGDVKTMSIVTKTQTKHVPDYTYETVDQSQWIVFPWERD